MAAKPKNASIEIHDVLVGLYPRLRRFAYGLTGSMDEAEDLVQSAYQRALERLDQWEPGTRLDSWMYRIIHSTRINRLRADRVRGKHLDPVDPDTQHGGDMRREMEAELTLDAVRSFLLTLPDEQRSVLMLVCVEGQSYAETANILGVPVGTVTSRLARGRLALREYVEHVQPNAPEAMTEPSL